MRNLKNHIQALAFFVIFSLFLPTFVLVLNASAEQDSGPSSESAVSQEELAQILAPLALYPDSLLSQMFMAATYPLEIVQADRFVKADPGLNEDALDKALKEKEWDISVKSLCHFPTVLASLSDNLDATKRLGDYFLDDQKAVMDMVQTLRAKAQAEGNLQTTDEQTVVVEETIIIIEPTNPEVIYVPYYDSTYVYGSWWYPHYPPYFWYSPSSRYGFTAGIIIGAGIGGGWARPNWRLGDIYIDINRSTNFNKHFNLNHRGKGNNSWKHNPKHRHGVAYNNKATRKNFGQSNRAAKKRDLGRRHTAQGLNRKTRDSINKPGLNSNTRQPSTRKQDRKVTQRTSRPTATTRQNISDKKQGLNNNARQSSTQKASRPSSRQNISGRQPSASRSQPQRSSAFNSSNSGQRTNQTSRRGSSSRNSSRGSSKSQGGRRR